MNSLEAKIHSQVAVLDDAALEALASKGLLRRAQKDLERGIAVTVEGEDANAVHLKVEQFRVSIPEAGPAKAKCSCPAAGICQHILVAILFLKRAAPAADRKPHGASSIEKELLSFTREQLEQWAGKASFRAALHVASQAEAEITLERGLAVRFASVNAQCHFAPGGGLDGIIVSGNTKDERRIAVAAVIAFQKSKGVTWETPAGAAGVPEEAEGAPRSRNEVMDASQQLMAEVLNNGLARVSVATRQRLATLAVSATGVNLPRLAMALRSLSDESALLVSRDARADAGRMLNRMAHTHALCAAIQQGGENPRPDLIGWHRTRYDEVGNLDLIGVAAWPWRTASGYAGLTVLLWDTINRRWNSWSESRPAQQMTDFDPVARYTQPGPWAGAESPRQLAQSCFRLMNARRNATNRLSASGKSRVLVTGSANLKAHGVTVVENWDCLRQSADALTAIGLKESNPLDSVFALKPAMWNQRIFNPITQIFSWLVLDAQQQPLVLEIPFEAYSEPAIKHLEAVGMDSLQDAMVIGRLQRTARGFSVFPFAIHQQDGRVVHLMLDTVPTVTPAPTAPVEAELDEEIEAEEENSPAATTSPAIGRLLDEVDENLLALCESGVASPNLLRVARAEQIAQNAERLGLPSLAASLGQMVSHPQAPSLLRCVHINQLYRRAMLVAV
jgi:hypothetical protein